MKKKFKKTNAFKYKIKKRIKILFKYILFFSFFSFCIFIFINDKIHSKIKNILIDKILFSKKNNNICDNFYIKGIINTNYQKIEEKVNSYCYIEKITLNQLQESILEDPWIKNIIIQKKLPDKLLIAILEHTPFAIWKKNDKEYLMNEYGDVININPNEFKYYKNLLTITGDKFKNEVYNLFNLLSIHPNLSKKIVRIDRIGARRWNLILNNDTIIKLPEEDREYFLKSWELANTVLNMYAIEKDLLEIDLRIESKIFLKYKKGELQEIQDNINKK